MDSKLLNKEYRFLGESIFPPPLIVAQSKLFSLSGGLSHLQATITYKLNVPFRLHITKYYLHHQA